MTGPPDLANSLKLVLFPHHLSHVLWFLIYLLLQVRNLTVQHTYHVPDESWLFQSSISLPQIFPKVWHCGWLGSCFSVSECHYDCCSCPQSLGLLFLLCFLNLPLSVHMLCTCHIVPLSVYVQLVETFYPLQHVMLLPFYATTKVQYTTVLLHYTSLLLSEYVLN